MKQLFFLFLFMLTLPVSSQKNSHSILTSPKDFQVQIDSTKKPVIIDIRTPEEYRSGHIKSAINFNFYSDSFKLNLANLDKTKTVFIYCLAGGRSANAAQIMLNYGFKNIIELDGGLLNWRAHNLPEQKANENKILDSTLTFSNYKLLILKKRKTLVSFYAPWCSPCLKMKPFLDKMSLDSLSFSIIRLNADENEILMKELFVPKIPYLILYIDGVKTWEYKGYISEENLKKELSVF